VSAHAERAQVFDHVVAVPFPTGLRRGGRDGSLYKKEILSFMSGFLFFMC